MEKVDLEKFEEVIKFLSDIHELCEVNKNKELWNKWKDLFLFWKEFPNLKEEIPLNMRKEIIKIVDNKTTEFINTKQNYNHEDYKNILLETIQSNIVNGNNSGYKLRVKFFSGEEESFKKEPPLSCIFILITFALIIFFRDFIFYALTK